MTTSTAGRMISLTKGTRCVSSRSREIFEIMSSAAVPVLPKSAFGSLILSGTPEASAHNPNAVVWYSPSRLSIAHTKIS